LHVHLTSDRLGPDPDDPFAGRHFDYWPLERLADVVIGAGFTIEKTRDDGEEWIDVEATRARTLPDTVGPGMRLLLVGLNPSVYSADIGAGFARPGNRFWPAALAAGIVSRTHDPFHALRVDGIGMTDLVKRATPRADELTREEFRLGAARLERLVEWLEPGAVCFVGLSGYRAAIDRKAAPGWQAQSFGGRPAYVMPNPSGINAHAKPAQLAEHLRIAVSPPRT
jgi:double-stranded uracil-DNA glycosylase